MFNKSSYDQTSGDAVARVAALEFAARDELRQLNAIKGTPSDLEGYSNR